MKVGDFICGKIVIWGDPQLVAAARCERIYRQLKRGGLRFHRGSVASFIQRETAAAICIPANAPHQDGRQLNFWEMTGGGNRWRIRPASSLALLCGAAGRFWSISVSFSLLSKTPPLIGSRPARPNWIRLVSDTTNTSPSSVRMQICFCLGCRGARERIWRLHALLPLSSVLAAFPFPWFLFSAPPSLY